MVYDLANIKETDKQKNITYTQADRKMHIVPQRKKSWKVEEKLCIILLYMLRFPYVFSQEESHHI